MAFLVSHFSNGFSNLSLNLSRIGSIGSALNISHDLVKCPYSLIAVKKQLRTQDDRLSF